MLVSDWLLESLACPRDRLPVTVAEEELKCAGGHRYPVVQGIPVMLLEDVAPTLPTHFIETLEHVSRGGDDQNGVPDLGVGTIKGMHPFVEQEIVATCGNMYRRLPGGLSRYPIPHLPLADGENASFLDVGSNWGRWALAASPRGYRSVGLDPSLKAALAGSRVACELGRDVHFVVGDARCLPFKEKSFHIVFSYSVLQHFDKQDAFDDAEGAGESQFHPRDRLGADAQYVWAAPVAQSGARCNQKERQRVPRPLLVPARS